MTRRAAPALGVPKKERQYVPGQTTTGSRIELARTQLGLSLAQAAQRVGVKRKTLENWENDRSEPRADKLVKLAGVLQVPLVWLFTGDHP